MADLIDMEKEKVTIKCDSCEKSLMHYIVISVTNTPFKMRATCPFCNGSSGIVSVLGRVFTGPIDKGESSNPTVIEDVIIDDVATFLIKKAKNAS